LIFGLFLKQQIVTFSVIQISSFRISREYPSVTSLGNRLITVSKSGAGSQIQDFHFGIPSTPATRLWITVSLMHFTLNPLFDTGMILDYILSFLIKN
jgi:hypothetical protein